jgi:peptidoglycan/xylan/chitin deacetylase (PgdA/CDA1 family)
MAMCVRPAAPPRSQLLRPGVLAVALGVACLARAAVACASGGAPRQADLRAAAPDACARDGDAVLHGPRRSRVVALTFDACPTSHVPGFSPEIVERLKADGVPATFFVSGRWAEAHPRELAQLAAVPFFEIALHGYRHHHLRDGALDAAVGEIEDGRQTLLRLGQTPQPLFRPPYGDHPRLLADAARRAGVTPVLWDVAPGDPDPHETASDIERDVLGRVRGGSIIIMHVNGRGVATAAALPAVLAGIRQRGLSFVKASELVSQCADASAAQRR